MPKSLVERVKHLLPRYERGILTWHGYVIELVCCSAYTDLAELGEFTSAKAMADLRERARNAPAHPEDVAIISGKTVIPGEALSDWDAQLRLEYYWGCRRLRESFFPELDPPEFEVELFIGTVTEVRHEADRVILVGDVKTHLIRRNSVFLRTNDAMIPVQFNGVKKIQADDHNAEAKSVSEWGIIVEIDAHSLPDIAEGTEVWLDRSEVCEIPKLPS